MDEIIEYPSGKRIQISNNFYSSEFDCPCGCATTKISKILVQRLQMLRNKIGKAIAINSGYRCAAYQQNLKERGYETAKGTSTHELGTAADVRADLSGLDLEAAARAVGFTSVGVAGSWCHVDTREGVRRWEYASLRR